MLTRSFVLTLLLASVLQAFAQDDSSTSGNTGGAGGGADTGSGGSLLVPNSSQPGGDTTLPNADSLFGGAVNPTGSDTTKPSASDSSDQPSFTLPGGYGSAPSTVTPGQGLYAKPPIAFTTTVQQGYNDNIYSVSSKPYLVPTAVTMSSPYTPQNPTSLTYPLIISQHYQPQLDPVLGSPFTLATAGTELLFSASRAVFSLDMSGGGQYYYDRPGTPFSPLGNLGLLFAYKLTPRAQFSASINGQYLNQPDLVLPNAPTQQGLGDYFVSNSRFDLSYQWGARFSTITTLSLGSEYFTQTSSQGNNYLTTTIGEAAHYALSPRFTGVFEVRAAQTQYDVEAYNSNTEFLLTGCDISLTHRFTGSVRVGESLAQYQMANAQNQSTPFLESTFNYGYGKASTLTWTARYGFENSAGNQSNVQKTFRSGVSLSQAFTAKLSASVSLSYANDDYATLVGDNSTSTDNTLTVGLNAQFIVNRSLTVTAGINRSQVFGANAWSSYAVDSVSLGATFHF